MINIVPKLNLSTLTKVVFVSCLTTVHLAGMAEDGDIFSGPSGGTAAPNVMFLVDNTANWGRSATNACKVNPSSCPEIPLLPGQLYNQSETVGGNELNAMIAAIVSLYTKNDAGLQVVPPNINVGLAMFVPGFSVARNEDVQNGYVRFGARNMSDPTTYSTIDSTTGTSKTRTAYSSLISILTSLNPTDPATKTNVGTKDEAESLYELYRYYKSQSPGEIPVSKSGLADYLGNSNSGAGPQHDAAGNNYTAYNSPNCGSAASTCVYRGPTTSCSKNFVIYVVNHGKNNGFVGLNSYNGVPSPALADIPRISVGGVTAERRRIVEWADFLLKNNIILYVVDVGVPTNNNGALVYDNYSVALQQAAKYGGGEYYGLADVVALSDFQLLADDLKKILIKIQATNSTFASVSLPISATNRAQNQNQVFIPMFRPDPDAKPRWKGNLKQYQLKIVSGGSIELADANGLEAVNSGTGFASPCAQSFWTTDSDTYWSHVTENPLPKGECTTLTSSVWSDSPDGPIVEKGGVAEVIRKGNNPAGATTWNLNRSIYTQPLAGGALAAFSSSSPGLESASGLSSSTIPTLSSMTNFILGQDVNSEYNSPPPPGVTSAPAALTRPSIHGDTIHSRPLPVTYSGSTGVYVYYGANDGMFRSINGATGQEQWAFVAPESYSKLKRLQTQSPLILYPNGPTNAAIPPAPKDYFFDGSIGLYQNADNSSIWIYPSMRRGGRMLYAFDVTSPTSPTFKWKVGCPNLTNDTDCSAVSTASPSSWASGLTSMGQTWSLPNVATRIPGHTGPVIIMGGGYDICEDANTSTPTCTNSKGALVYVIDANTGELLASFPTGYGRSVVADVALIAVTTSGVVDRAYAVDTGGNIFRIDFNAGGPGSWAMKRVAYTNGAGRKFLYAPALFRNTGNFVYLALGSGDREHPLQSQYPYTTPVVNRFYAYRDDLSLSSSAPAINLDDTSEGIINILPGVGCVDANTPISSTILPTSNSHGWFLNLNQYGTGEQTVTSALIVAGMVTFSTNRAVPPVGGSCSTTLGEARGYFLNLINGSGAVGVTKNCGGALSSTFVAGGMPLTPVFANVEIGGQTYPIVIGAVQRQGGANSPISPQQMSHTTGTNRKTLYWKSRVD